MLVSWSMPSPPNSVRQKRIVSCNDGRMPSFVGSKEGAGSAMSARSCSAKTAQDRLENIAGAETEIGRLQSLEDKLKGNDTYWGNQVEVQRSAAAGILAQARGE